MRALAGHKKSAGVARALKGLMDLLFRRSVDHLLDRFDRFDRFRFSNGLRFLGGFFGGSFLGRCFLLRRGFWLGLGVDVTAHSLRLRLGLGFDTSGGGGHADSRIATLDIIPAAPALDFLVVLLAHDNLLKIAPTWKPGEALVSG